MGSPRRFHVIAFDLYGTLLDLGALGDRLSAILGSDGTGLLASWRKLQLEKTWELARAGAYRPFDEVTVEALAEAAPEFDGDLRAKLEATWLAPPPYPDAAGAL